jgi:drug/metabolite transporter (DMT)-like permease|tara:strand:- start:770 stop:1189 length:420 start_codon:yes stop_codon:yes gene_type:complete
MKSKTVTPHQHDHRGMKLTLFLSTLCLIHCITFPILIVLMPVFNIAFHPPEWIEYVLLGSTAVLGYYSMRHGFSLHHHARYPVLLFTIGIFGAFGIHLIFHHSLNAWLIAGEVFFAILIALSQIINYRLTNTNACTSAH